MTDFPRIINTEIIDTTTDIFWHNNLSILGTFSPKPVLVITNTYPENSTEETQLQKILDACKLTTEAYNILQLPENEKVAWHSLKNSLKPDNVILFGVHPNQLGISALFRLNAANKFDGITIIPTLSLPELEKQPQAKKDLWVNALKPIFADN